MPGFRPGKVPANLVRKMHGPALLQDALNTALQEGVQTLIAEQGLRPAMQPQVELAEGYEQGQDAKLTVTLEVLPQVPTPAIDALKLERLTVPVADEAVDEQLQKFADQQKRWDDAGDKAAEQGDQVTVDFVGKTLDGVAFEGGSGGDMAVEIGGGRLIPGFEDQLGGGGDHVAEDVQNIEDVRGVHRAPVQADAAIAEALVGGQRGRGIGQGRQEVGRVSGRGQILPVADAGVPNRRGRDRTTLQREAVRQLRTVERHHRRAGRHIALRRIKVIGRAGYRARCRLGRSRAESDGGDRKQEGGELEHRSSFET